MTDNNNYFFENHHEMVSSKLSYLGVPNKTIRHRIIKANNPHGMLQGFSLMTNINSPEQKSFKIEHIIITLQESYESYDLSNIIERIFRYIKLEINGTQIVKLSGWLLNFLNKLNCKNSIKYIDNKNLTIADFGTGAGFPGVILSILGVKEVHLVEKSFRKCEFLQMAAKISSNKIIVHQKRAEEIKDLKVDIAVSRAFAPLSMLLKTIKPFLNKQGYGIFLKGKNFANEINLAKQNNNFHYNACSSLTSKESRVIIINEL
jgi:16S rRNA (guanine527-N7)-methyltransferase